ncbi:hypothetical protein D3C85_1566110 [compost metagenome]
MPSGTFSLTIEYVSASTITYSTPVDFRYSGRMCSGKPGCFWSRFIAISLKLMGARFWSAIRTDSMVYESFPPLMQTSTVSPSSIMPKSPMALPVSDWRRVSRR